MLIGREAPGKAYRLYTERAFDDLEPTTLPEIQRTNLCSVVLQLKALGINDVLGFDFMDAPPRAAILRSLELLLALGALDSKVWCVCVCVWWWWWWWWDG